MSDGRLAFKLPFDKLVVIKGFIGQSQAGNGGFIRPARFFIGTTFRANASVSGKIRAAIGTIFHNPRLSHTRVFFVGEKIESHENVVVRNGLHIFHVIGQMHELAEA